MNTATEGTEKTVERKDQAIENELQEAIAKYGVKEGIKYINDKVNAQDTVVKVRYKLKCFQLEGAYAIHQAVEKVIGFVDLTVTEGASGDTPPQLLDVRLPNGTSIKVPWGVVALPGTSNEKLSMSYDDYSIAITITGDIKKSTQPMVDKIIEETKDILAKSSIYKGQAFNLEFEDDDDYVLEPTFIDLSNIDEKKVLLPKEAKDGLVPILARIKDTDKCIEQGLDLKYGALMEGPYGTGKTLTAFLIAKIAIAHGWTFIYLKDCKCMAKTLKIAENYCKTTRGVVIFTEDIDQALRGSRDSAMQGILNTLDGGDTKGLPIISVFTTNHIEMIEPTFMRGKRIGGLISLGALDKDTATQFITNLVVDGKGESLMEDENCDSAADALTGIVPAFASEVIDKSKAYMISRGSNKISCEDIIKAADSYKKQMKFAEMKVVDEEEAKLENALKMVLSKGENGVPNDILLNFVNRVADRVGVQKLRKSAFEKK